jgi:predicted nucleotidyltransferase component of viral defense system
MAEAIYRKQVALLLRTLPLLAEETCFALKGGTAINLFVRDMPRLSVDIDLAYLPVSDREESLRAINSALRRIEARILKTVKGSKVQPSVLPGTKYAIKLVVRQGDAQIKIEVTPVLRGTVFPSSERDVVDTVENEFGYARMQVVSFQDLYAGKLMAALDRQHPRDLFDVMLLIANEGINRELFQAFLVYLISHDRPMAEILDPVRRDIRQEFERGFVGMTNEPIERERLEQTREEMIAEIRAAFTDDDKRFLLSVKEGKPDWSLLLIADIDKLPAVRWKLINIQKLDIARRKQLVESLNSVLYPGTQP